MQKIIDNIEEGIKRGKEKARLNSELDMLLASPLEDDEISIIKERCLNTTGGVWIAEIKKRDASWPGEYQLIGGIPLDFGWDGEEGIYGDKDDLDFIGHSKQDILRLIATIEKLKQGTG